MKITIRRILLAVVLLLALGLTALYFPLDFLRAPAEHALERGLGRKVDVGAVYLNLFGVPGLTLDNVVIHEDPRAGLEPFAYVDSLDAGIRALGLLRRRLEFSSISLGAATVNLVKTTAGPWNFQLLLGGAPAARESLPSIKMRAGRVNFKFGDTKSVFYFNDADFDVDPESGGLIDLRFGGAPSRTDRSHSDFGRLYARGTWSASSGMASSGSPSSGSAPSGPRLDLQIELERSSVDEVSRLIDPRGFGLHGIIAAQAQLSGSPSSLRATGQIDIEDVHRWDLLPQGGKWTVPFEGALDLRQGTLDLASASPPDTPLAFDFHLTNLLGLPEWNAGARFHKVPVAALVEVARHMGGAIPGDVSPAGSVSGEVRYTAASGLDGELELNDASLTLPDAAPLQTATAAFDVGGGSIRLEPSTVEIGGSDTAEIEGEYSFAGPHALDLKITTRGLSAADLHSFGIAAVPLLDRTPSGTWRGWAEYRNGEWSGDYDLQNARVAIDGLSEPLRIQSAAVKLSGERIAVSKLHARLGKISLTGSYRRDPDALRPDKFDIRIAEADAAQLQGLLAPSLVRDSGFLARTLRLAPDPLPDWLKSRRAEGTLAIDSLTAGPLSLRLDGARMLWDGGEIRLTGIDAHTLDPAEGADQAALSGDLRIGMEGRAPEYHFDGKLLGVPYKGGQLDFEGSLDAQGTGLGLLASARAVGHLRGQSIEFSRDAEFTTAAACFEMSGLSPAARWKLRTVEVSLGGETLSGSGATQPDGKLALDLSRPGRQVRYTGTLMAGVP